MEISTVVVQVLGKYYYLVSGQVHFGSDCTGCELMGYDKYFCNLCKRLAGDTDKGCQVYWVEDYDGRGGSD